MKYKKVLALATFLTLISTPSAFAKDNHELPDSANSVMNVGNGTVQELYRKTSSALNTGAPAFTAKILVSDNDGTSLYEISKAESLKEALQEEALGGRNFTDQTGAPIVLSQQITNGEVLYLFSVEQTSSSQQISIPSPIVTKKTPYLASGVTEVDSQGTAGVGIFTTVISDPLSQDQNLNSSIQESSASLGRTTTQTFTIITPPTPKIILVGTGASSTFSSSNGWASTDATLIKRLTLLNADNPKVLNALGEVGKPYVWGAEGPDSFDCSGLVYWAFSHAGYSFGRTTANAYGHMSTPVEVENIQPGDILWTASHIAIYAGDGMVVHAANPSVGVVITPLSFFLDSGFKIGSLPIN